MFNPHRQHHQVSSLAERQLSVLSSGSTLTADGRFDTIYPTSLKDSDGKDCSGSNNYVMRFPEGQLPPSSP